MLKCLYHPIKRCEATDDERSLGSPCNGAKRGKEVTPHREGGVSSSNHSGIFNSSLHEDLLKSSYVRGGSHVVRWKCHQHVRGTCSQLHGVFDDVTGNGERRNLDLPCYLCLGIQPQKS